MSENLEPNFNRISQILDETETPSAKDIAMAQLASDFHKDRRQRELIETIERLTATVNQLNIDTGRLYGRLNSLTLVIALATLIGSAAAIVHH